MKFNPVEVQQLLDNKVFNYAFESIRNDLIERMRSIDLCAVDSHAKVLELTRQLQIVDSIKSKVERLKQNQQFTDHNESARRLRDS